MNNKKRELTPIEKFEVKRTAMNFAIERQYRKVQAQPSLAQGPSCQEFIAESQKIFEWLSK